MIEKSSLDAIKADLMKAKKYQEQTLKRLNEIKSKSEGTMDPAQLKEINKTIKAIEKSLKLYANL